MHWYATQNLPRAHLSCRPVKILAHPSARDVTIVYSKHCERACFEIRAGASSSTVDSGARHTQGTQRYVCDRYSRYTWRYSSSLLKVLPTEVLKDDLNKIWFALGHFQQCNVSAGTQEGVKLLPRRPVVCFRESLTVNSSTEASKSALRIHNASTPPCPVWPCRSSVQNNINNLNESSKQKRGASVVTPASSR